MTIEMINEQMMFAIQQLDSLDQLSTNYVMTVIGFIALIITAIMAMLGTSKWLGNKDNTEENKVWIKILNRTISMAFLTFPSISVLFMYVFAGNCRKVAFYRGYVMHLEDLLNSKANSSNIESFFNHKSLELYGLDGVSDFSSFEEFFGKSFFSMSCGSVVMIIFIFIILAISFILSRRFAKRADEEAFTQKCSLRKCICKWGYVDWFKAVYVILAVVSSLFIIMCVVDLLSNNCAMNVLYRNLNELAGLQVP